MLDRIKYWCERNIKRDSLAWKIIFAGYKVMIVLRVRVSRMKGSLGVLPDFLIIGTQKGGTSSLFYYIEQHPFVKAPCRKGIFFFDKYYKRGVNWYKSHFPMRLGRKFVTGEASACYMFYPEVPERVHALLPDVKIVVLLRNPIDRAFSAYNMEKRRGNDDMSFEDAVKNEKDRTGNMFGFRYHSYVSRGEYADQLERWFKLFPKEQIFILESEEMYSDPQKTMDKVFGFLGLKQCRLKKYPKTNTGSYSKMDVNTRKKLAEHFKPFNERLYKMIGKDLHWL